MKFSAAIVVCAVAASLAGCGVVAKVNARNEMTQSEATYKACLAQHPQDIRPCDGARLAYEARKGAKA